MKALCRWNRHKSLTVSNSWMKFCFTKNNWYRTRVNTANQILCRMFFPSVFLSLLRILDYAIIRFIYDLRERVTICPGKRERNSLASSHKNTINGVELSSSLRVSYYVQLAWDADGREGCRSRARSACGLTLS